MDIYYVGGASFKLSGKDTTLLFFPEAKNKADIVIGKPDLVSDVHKAVEGPGEYEIRGVSVFGYRFGYLVEMDGVRVLYISDITQTPSDDDISHVGEVDVLLANTNGDVETFNKKFGPSVTVPYGDHVQAFVEKAGVSAEPIPKLAVKAGSFLPEDSKVVILTQK